MKNLKYIVVGYFLFLFSSVYALSDNESTIAIRENKKTLWQTLLYNLASIGIHFWSSYLKAFYDDDSI